MKEKPHRLVSSGKHLKEAPLERGLIDYTAFVIAWPFHIFG